MIEVIQVGQAGKTKLLFSMHRLRKKVFQDRMKWSVHVTKNGLEIDQFDISDAVYLLAVDHEERVRGSWRLLPSTGPTMIRDIWSQSLSSNPMPSRNDVWEASRFSVDTEGSVNEGGLNSVGQVTGELFLGLTELCLANNIKHIFTLYDARIARLLKRLDCSPSVISQKFKIDSHDSQTGRFDITIDMLRKIQNATGIHHSILSEFNFPLILKNYPQDKMTHQEQTNG